MYVDWLVRKHLLIAVLWWKVGPVRLDRYLWGSFKWQVQVHLVCLMVIWSNCFTCSYTWVSITMTRCWLIQLSHKSDQRHFRSKTEGWTDPTLLDMGMMEALPLGMPEPKRRDLSSVALLWVCVDADARITPRRGLALDLSLHQYAQSFGIPWDRGVLRVRSTRLSLSWWKKLWITFVRCGIHRG